MLQPVAPLAVLLEGGYNLSATAAATEACLRVLLGETAPALPIGDRAPSPYGLATIQQVIRTQVHTMCSLLCCLCVPNSILIKGISVSKTRHLATKPVSVFWI